MYPTVSQSAGLYTTKSPVTPFMGYSYTTPCEYGASDLAVHNTIPFPGLAKQDIHAATSLMHHCISSQTWSARDPHTKQITLLTILSPFCVEHNCYSPTQCRHMLLLKQETAASCQHSVFFVTQGGRSPHRLTTHNLFESPQLPRGQRSTTAVSTSAEA
jgi:hypothetical protein